MSAKKAPKLGNLHFTEKEREMIAQFVATNPVYTLIKNKVRAARQVQIGQMTVRTGQNSEDLWLGKGKLIESDWLVETFDRVAKDAEKAGAAGDEDVDDVDTEI